MSLFSKRDYVGRDQIPVRQPNKNIFQGKINFFFPINQTKKQELRTPWYLSTEIT